MVIADESTLQLGAIENALYSLLKEGKIPDVEGIGGFDLLFASTALLSKSPLASQVLAAVLRDVEGLDNGDERPWRGLISNLVQGATEDLVLIEMVDALNDCVQLPAGTSNDVFMAFLQKVGDVSGAITGYSRAIALEGAFRFAIMDRRMQFRLLDLLLGIQASDEPIFLRYAAKIVGIAHSHWRESELVGVLITLLECDEARYEASFELGMANLVSALDEPQRNIAASLFMESLHWFRKAELMQETTPEASLYSECLKLLTDFEACKTEFELKQRSTNIQKMAFELLAWHGDQNSPAWLGVRHVQSVYWNELAVMLATLAGSLEKVTWWEPRVVIEQQVLAAYSAGRTVLKWSHDGYLETLLRPRIDSSIAQREGQAYLLKHWLEQNSDHELIPEANAILCSIEEIMSSQAMPLKKTYAAATVWAPVAAVLTLARCKEPTERRIREMIASAVSSSLEGLSLAEIEIYDNCIASVESHPDYRNSMQGAKLFNTVLLWMVRFLKNRLDMTKQSDPSVAYLFEPDDGKLPVESALQDDYYRWFNGLSGSGELELSNMGGGRVDIALRSAGERIVVEVKRELHDASFDALVRAYAGQTADYQNVSIRLGFLLVLDLTEVKADGTPHIRNLIESRFITRKGETEPRHIVIVKVPGRRLLPSAISRIAKSSRPRKII